MDAELKRMGDFVSLFKFVVEEEQHENHGAIHVESPGSEAQFYSDSLSSGEKVMDITKSKKTHYRRLSSAENQELLAAYQLCPHPDDKLREELARKLSMSKNQVKYWFQNHRTHMKTSMDQFENNLLQKVNEKLRVENTELKKMMMKSICPTCEIPLVPSVDHKGSFLLVENSWLKDEYEIQRAILSKLMAKPAASVLSSDPSPSALVTPGCNPGSNSLRPSSVVLQPSQSFVSGSMPIFHNVTGSAVDDYDERNFLGCHAKHAMEEFINLVQENEPLWLPTTDIMGLEGLNHQMYYTTFSRTYLHKPVNFVVNATRDNSIVMGRCVDIVGSLLDAHRWSEMFPGIVASAKTTGLISSGLSASSDGLIQLMHAELQVMSPAVPVCDVTFLRYSKKQADGLWAVVDVSIDAIIPTGSTSAQSNVNSSRTAAGLMGFRLFPSGCLIQDMNNGYSKVTWVVHAAYDIMVVPQLYRPLLHSGKGLGACRWVASLQRQRQFLACLHNSICSSSGIVTERPRPRNVLQLVKKMMTSFTTVCAAMAKIWPCVERNSSMGFGLDDTTHIMSRNVGDALGGPTGRVLCATTSVWLSGVKPRRVYDYLRDEKYFNGWRCHFPKDLRQGNGDIPMNGETVQKFCRIVEGLHEGHAISVISSRVAIGKTSSTLFLQDARTDQSGALIVYAGIDVHTMHAVMRGNVDPATIFLLPSGCAILPDCRGTSAIADQASCSSSVTTGNSNTHGSFVTVTYQMFVCTDAGSVSKSIQNAHKALEMASIRCKATLQAITPE